MDALGYDFDTVEFAVRDGMPYAIDFMNPAPDADVDSVGEDNFEWIVETLGEVAHRAGRAAGGAARRLSLADVPGRAANRSRRRRRRTATAAEEAGLAARAVAGPASRPRRDA